MIKTFDSQKNLIKKIVFIDGIPRSGKTAMASVLPSLHKSESIEFCNFLEQILPGLSLNSINFAFAKSYINKTFDELAYNKLIGRNSNFRPTDLTSITNYRNPKLYKKRLFKEEGEKAIKELKKSKNFFPFVSHDLMSNINYLNKLDLNFKLIEIYRNPIDNVYSWFRRGVAKSFEKNSRIFTILLKAPNGRLCPWYIQEDYKEWFKFNDMEKCVHLVMKLINRSIIKQRKFRTKKILTINFENFVQFPDEELKRICSFLNTQTTNQTKYFLRKANVPRRIKDYETVKKANEIRGRVSKSLFEKLMSFEENYNKKTYGFSDIY